MVDLWLRSPEAIEVDDASILGQLDHAARGQGCPLPSLNEIGDLGFR